MFVEDYRPNQRGRIVLYYALSLCLLIVLMLFFSSWRSKPFVETITVDSSRSKPVLAQPVSEQRVSGPADLPVVDRDIETAGDRIAAAVIYLKRKQNEPALNALEQAAAATQRALVRKPGSRDQLLATNQQIETVELLIRSGRIRMATTALKDLDQ